MAITGEEMKTFTITWDTNYGERVMIVNFEDIETVGDFAESHEQIWPSYEIKELSNSRGVVFCGGGDE